MCSICKHVGVLKVKGQVSFKKLMGQNPRKMEILGAPLWLAKKLSYSIFSDVNKIFCVFFFDKGSKKTLAKM